MQSNTIHSISALVLGMATSISFAQVDDAYSSVESRAYISLSNGDGSDETILLDEQFESIDPLVSDVEASFANGNGSYFGSMAGAASFADAGSGTFDADSVFWGSDSGIAMGGYSHTLSSNYEYRFTIPGEGTLLVDGTLLNSDLAFKNYIRITVSSETTLGGGYIGNFFDENIIDPSPTIPLAFHRTVPLVASSGSYRLRISFIGNGVGLRQQDTVVSSIVSSWSIQTDSPCAADLTGDGILNFFDVSAFLSAFASMDMSADLNGDGIFNFFDVSAFLSAFSAGCP